MRPRVRLAAWLLLAVWALVSAPGLFNQWSRSGDLRRAVGARDAEAAAELLDAPVFPAAQQIASVVPDEGCVLVLAYAGTEAADYYRARLDYLLYPRGASVSTDSSASRADCSYLAVLRDTPQNLQAAPFRGQWDERALSIRLASLELLHRGDNVEVYRTP